VAARRSAEAQGSGSLDQSLTAPLGSLAGSASGSGQVSGLGKAEAQLIGTDAVRGIAGSAVRTARGEADQNEETPASAAEYGLILALVGIGLG
jgi:hypothetical protein